MTIDRRRALALGLIGAAASSGLGWHWIGRGLIGNSVVNPAGVPFQPPIHVPGFLGTSRDEAIATVEAKLCRLEKESVSTLLHWLRVVTTGPLVERYRAAVDDVITDLTDAVRMQARFQEKSPLVQTPYGVRYVASDPQDSTAWVSRGIHVNQTLSVFAEIGLPLEQRLRLQEGQATLRDVLADCLANCHLQAAPRYDVEFAALAIALYLPPARTWQDRWGQQHTLDDLADYVIGVLDRPRRGATCAGTHLLEVLALLAAVHRQKAILGPAAAQRVTDWLCTIPSVLQRTQRANGSWGVDWRGRGQLLPQSLNGPTFEVLATGHLVETLLTFPPEAQPPADIMVRAFQFLLAALAAAPSSTITKEYCPYSHAGRCVLLWATHGA